MPVKAESHQIVLILFYAMTFDELLMPIHRGVSTFIASMKSNII